MRKNSKLLSNVYKNVFNAWVLFREMHRETDKALPLYQSDEQKKIDEDLAFALADLERIIGSKEVEDLIYELEDLIYESTKN